MKVVGYLRVSSESGVDRKSIAAQERLFNELCKSHGWQPVGIYRKEGRSARVESVKQRPVFQKILEDAVKNKFDALAIHTLDHRSRNLWVTPEFLKTLVQHGIGLVSITENIDHAISEGRLFTRMLGSFASTSLNPLPLTSEKAGTAGTRG